MIGRTPHVGPTGPGPRRTACALMVLLMLGVGCGPQADWSQLNEQAKRAAGDGRAEPLQVAQVPLPPAFWLFAAALAAGLLTQRRRRSIA